PAISGSNRQASRPCSGVARPVIRAVNSVGKGHVPILGSPVGGGVRVSTPIVAGEPFRAYPASATGQVANVLSESAVQGLAPLANDGRPSGAQDPIIRHRLVPLGPGHLLGACSQGPPYLRPGALGRNGLQKRQDGPVGGREGNELRLPARVAVVEEHL